MKRPFEIFDIMNQADEAKGSALLGVCPDLIEAKTASGGGNVTIGVPAEVVTQLLTGDRKAVLLVFDKKEYDRIGNQK
jgi:hypothetical protein